MNRDCGMRNAECGLVRNGRRARRIRNPQSEIRNGVTLVELLIAMAIVAILAAIFLGAQNAALNAARASRTKATITKIHTLLMQKWDDYKTARLDIQMLPPPVRAPTLPGQVRADLMLDALRMTQKLEMPDHWSDILGLQGECRWRRQLKPSNAGL